MTQIYPHLAFVYFETGYPMLFQFRFSRDTPFAELIPSLNTLLRYPENRKVVKLEYRSPSLNDEGHIKFTPFEIKNDEDLAVLWTTFDRFVGRARSSWTRNFKDRWTTLSKCWLIPTYPCLTICNFNLM